MVIVFDQLKSQSYTQLQHRYGYLSFKLARSSKANVFNDESYVRILNDLLRLELGASSFYRQKGGMFSESWVQDVRKSHHHLARKLTRLILVQGGMVAKDTALLSSDFSLFLSSVSQRLGERFAAKAIPRLCMGLESLLLKRYQTAWEQAPSIDRIILASMKQTIRTNQLAIQKLL